MRHVSDMTPGITSPSGRWHVPEAVIAAYVAEDISEADAWSTESHLARCGRCRADLAALVDGGLVGGEPVGSGTVRDAVMATRGEVLARVGQSERAPAGAMPQVPGQSERVPAGARSRVAERPMAAGRMSAVATWARPALVLRGPWVTAVAVAVLVAAAAELVTSQATGIFGGVSMIALLGPLVPLAGVGLCYRATDRGWAEAVLATPAAGLRLVLWRVLAVLVIAIPITGVVAAFDHRAAPMTWLLPALGLAAASLALGTRVELGRATAVVAVVWTAVMVAPALMTQRVPIDMFSGVAQGFWAALLLGCLAVMVVRRAEFGRLPAWRPAMAGRVQ